MGTVTLDERLKEEIRTWCIPDSAVRQEKVQRERIRHPQMIRDLLLDRLDTSAMEVLEVGGGPIPLSNLLDYRNRTVIDPCTEAYRDYYWVPDHIAMRGEDLASQAGWFGVFDLAICTNALDHVDYPNITVHGIEQALKPGGFFAVMCAENNAMTNPHPCHTINLTPKDLHHMCDGWAETVWELNYERDGYRYGWAEHNGKRGQPAFAILFRKCIGY